FPRHRLNRACLRIVAKGVTSRAAKAAIAATVNSRSVLVRARQSLRPGLARGDGFGQIGFIGQQPWVPAERKDQPPSRSYTAGQRTPLAWSSGSPPHSAD